MILEFCKKAELIIQRMKSEDSACASQLHANRFNPAWSYASFYQFLNDPQILGWSAYIQGQPEQMLGFLLLRFIADEAEILTILTKKTWENRGIGSNLLRTSMQALHELRINNLYLDVDENNQKAINLYNKFHFKPISMRKAYYDNGPKQKRSNAIVMCYKFCYNN